MRRLNGILKTALTVSALALAGPAMASTIVMGGPSSNGSDGNSRTYTDGSTSVRVSGWAITGDGSIENGSLGQWSMGAGVNNSSDDNSHTIDNVGWIDFIVLQFSSSVILEAVNFATGWYDRDGRWINDTDATIGYGNLALPLSQSPNWDEVPSTTAFSGFSFFGSNSVGGGSQTRAVNPLDYGGNTWIIMATQSNPDRYYDGFKVGGVTFSQTSSVPEPATWLTLILGFGLVGGVMRREKQKVRIAYA